MKTPDWNKHKLLHCWLIFCVWFFFFFLLLLFHKFDNNFLFYTVEHYNSTQVFLPFLYIQFYVFEAIWSFPLNATYAQHVIVLFKHEFSNVVCLVLVSNVILPSLTQIYLYFSPLFFSSFYCYCSLQKISQKIVFFYSLFVILETNNK